MNKDIECTISRFLQDVTAAGQKISKFSQDINSKDKTLLNIIENFNKSLNMLSIDEKENEFTIQLKETLTQYKEKTNVWMDLIKAYIIGKEFINQFEKSVLFVVFGNVNVGKSSVGNFIGGVTEGLKEYYNRVPEFFVYDFADKNSNKEPVKLASGAFKENYTEETTTIQYYTLNDGLTWVDSPGIHSINGENEALAKKYVDYADLVLFVMSSSSPAKYDEFFEVSRLMDKQKPLLVIINKSDKLEHDEVDGELVEILVAKSDSDRRKQEQYVKDLFSSNPSIKYLQGVDSISISTHLAKNALLENNNNRFIESGVPKFYEKLGAMLKENALELKHRAPKQRVNSIINEILNGFTSNDIKVDGISEIKNSFEQIDSKIDEKILQIKNLEKSMLKDVRAVSMPDIDLAISKLSAKLQSGNDIGEIEKTIENIILDNFNSELQKKISKLINDFKHESVKTLNMKVDVKLEAKYETFKYTEYTVKEVGRDPEGLIEHVGAFFGKKYSRIKTISKEIDKTIIVGDNSTEVIDKIISNLEVELQPITSRTLSDIARNYFSKEKELVLTIIDKLNEVESALNREIMR